MLKCSEIESVPIDVPYQKLSAKQKKWILEGSHGKSEFAKSNWRGVYSFFQKWKRNLIKCMSVFFSRDTDHMMTVRSAKEKTEKEPLNWKVREKDIHEWSCLELADVESEIKLFLKEIKQSNSLLEKLKLQLLSLTR